MPGKTVEALSELLDVEREALLEGDLDRLARLLKSKEELIEELNGTPQSDLDAVQMLDGKVKRNQLLLNGALEGIRAVADRLAHLRQARGTLETYGPDGKRYEIELTPEKSVEHRV